MTKDGNILEELVKIRTTYKQDEFKFIAKPVMRFENLTHAKYMKIKRLEKKLKCGVLVNPEGNLDTINLIGHYKQYDITLKEAFEACKKNNMPVGCSLVFMPKKLKWMNK